MFYIDILMKTDPSGSIDIDQDYPCTRLYHDCQLESVWTVLICAFTVYVCFIEKDHFQNYYYRFCDIIASWLDSCAKDKQIE